jgi:hypothetical protein
MPRSQRADIQVFPSPEPFHRDQRAQSTRAKWLSGFLMT